jgi:hypothetical protein
MHDRATECVVPGVRLPVASIEDVLQGRPFEPFIRFEK